MACHSTEIQRPTFKWTPLQLMSTRGRREEELCEHISRLQQELRDFRDYADRLTKELRWQQIKSASQEQQTDEKSYVVSLLQQSHPVGIPVGGTDGNSWIHEIPLSTWGLNMQLMCPLLVAYDDRQQELQRMVDRREQELKSLSTQVKEVVKENEELAHQLKAKTLQMQAFYELESSGDDGAVRSPALISQERNELEQLYQVTQEQNAVLARQAEILKAQVQTEKEQAAQIAQECTELKEAKSGNVRKKDDMEQQLLKCEKERNMFQQSLFAAYKEIQKLSGECETTKAALALREGEDINDQDSRRAFQQVNELQQALNSERECYENRMKFLTEKEAETSASHKRIERTVTELQDTLAAVSKERDKLTKESQNSKQLLQQLETKITKLINEKKQLTQELEQKLGIEQRLFLEKDKAVAAETGLRKQLDSFKAQYDSELKACEKKCKENANEEATRLQKQASQLQQKALTAERIKEEYAVKVEISERQLKAAQMETERVSQELSMVHQSNQKFISQLQTTQSNLERERSDLTEELRTVKDMLAEETTSLRANLQKHLDEGSTLSIALDSEKSAKRGLMENVRMLKEENLSLESCVEGLRKEKDRSEAHYNDEIEKMRSAERERSAQLKKRLAEATKSQEFAEQQLSLLKQNFESQKQKMSRDNALQQREQENKINRLQSSNKNIRTKMVELLQNLQSPAITSPSYSLDMMYE